MIGQLLEPLGRRLILLFAIVLIVPSAFGIVAAIDHFHQQEAAAYQSVRRYAVLASNNEAGVLWQSERIAESLQRDASVAAVVGGADDASSTARCDSALAQSILPYPTYGTAALFDGSGTPICVWDRSRGTVNVADRDWFHDAVQSRSSIVSKPVTSRLTGEPLIVYGTPIADSGGEVRAILGLGIRLNWLASVGHEPGLPSESEVYLLDQDGDVLVDASRGIGDESSTLPDSVDLGAVLRSAERSFQAVSADGKTRIYAIHSIGRGLYTVLGVPQDMLIGPLWRDLLIRIAVLCVVSAAGLAAALLGARLLVTRWTESLTKAARSADLSVLAAIELRGAPIELRELGDTLKALAARVEAREAELQSSLDQKQLMLREIHHRVKNNLQMVTSLMNLHARLHRSEEFKQSFAEIQLRVNALALVHRHLYESQDMQDIDLAPFMSNLCAMLQDAAGISPRQVKLTARIPELRLNGDRAVPLALLTAEVVTNSFKHAFPGARIGSIKVEMTVDDADNVILSVVDDGVGPPPATGGPSTSLGRTLIDAFTKQLGGAFTMHGPPGMTSVLSFNLRHPTQSVVPAAATG